MSESFGDRLRQERKRYGVSQETLAARSGISFQAISDIELGKVSPRVSTAVALAKALGVSAGSLIDDNHGETNHEGDDTQLSALELGHVMVALSSVLGATLVCPTQTEWQATHADAIASAMMKMSCWAKRGER